MKKIDLRLSCIVTKDVLVNKQKIMYMYRDEPTSKTNSGWCFFTGEETDEYVNDVNNLIFCELQDIVDYDVEISPYLGSDIGTAFMRDELGMFCEDVIDYTE